MEAADPLSAVPSTTCLLPGTLGGAVPAASPSKADWALIRVMSGTLKGSSELIEQSKIVRKGYSDIRMVYQDGGGKTMAATNCQVVYQGNGGKAMAAANGENNQLGRRLGVERKRHQFTMKYPMSKPLPVVDRSVLDTIVDPDEYFAKEVQLNEAEAEIKRLNAEDRSKRTLNFEPVVERQRRNSSRPRKSYCFNSDAHAASVAMIPASQSENMTESQISQDDTHASVYEQNDQSVPPNKSAILDSLVEADSFGEKNESDEITNILASFQSFDGPDKVGFLRKTLGIGEIQMEKNYHRDSILGHMPLGSTAQKTPHAVCALEGALPGSHQARVSELVNRIFRDSTVNKHKNLWKDDEFEGHTLQGPSPGSHQAQDPESAECMFRDIAMDKHTNRLKDDEFEGSPDIVMAEKSPVHYSSDDVLMTEETFCASEKVREASGPSAKSAEHVPDPESNMQDCGSIAYDPYRRDTISTEKENVPMDLSTIDRSNNESVISSHHLKDASAEVLANTPRRDVAPIDIARTSHSYENNIEHQEVAEEDGVVQDKSTQLLEIPPEVIGSENQSQAPDGAIKNLITELRTALSPSKEKTEKTAQREEILQQPKRVKKMVKKGDFRHSLEIPQADFDSENKPHTDDVNTEKNTLLPTKEKTQIPSRRGDNKPQPKRGKKVAAQRGKNKQQPKRAKKVADESRHLLEIPQSDFDSENQPHTHDVNTEQQTVVMSNAPPEKPNRKKEAQRRHGSQKPNKRQSLADAGLEWQSGLRRSTRVRHRPLEQWCGEKFIYGRIHDTMITVIGVKSYSPGEDGKRALKVKSFVPQQYSDIVVKGAKN